MESDLLFAHSLIMRFLNWKGKAEDNSEDLASQIVLDLCTVRPVVEDFVMKLLREHRLRFRTNANTEETYTDKIEDYENEEIRYLISLGLEQIGSDTLEQIQFDYESFTQEELIQYRLLHELVHCIFDELLSQKDPNLKALISIALSQRSQDKRFFTGLATFKSSRTTRRSSSYNIPEGYSAVSIVEEDIVELLTMYLWNSTYFKRFLQFALNPAYESIRQRYGIRTLTPDSANALLKLIKQITESINS